ncbi:MAG: amino acid ABC transporter permease [Oscillospiraceae bacterium]|nr:amino acid ABC transporter permease [Oscillospiraceae bacterium]
MAVNSKRNARAGLAAFLLKHRTGCIVAIALLLVCAALALLKPSQQQLRDNISQEFIAASGTRYYPADVNLLVVGVACGRDVRSAATETYIGFAGRVIKADIDRGLEAEIKALNAPVDRAQNRLDAQNRKYKETGDPADKPTGADKAQLKQAKAERREALRTPELRGKASLLRRQSAKSAVADIVLWIPPLVDGSRITISLTIVSVIAGVFLSVFFALGKITKFKPVQAFCSAYIFFFRGTPLLMQLLVVYFGLPMLDKRLAINSAFSAAVIAFTLNTAAYCAEIIRAAIQSIDKGQFEASHALGFTYAQTMRLIIIPQSIRRLIPPIANEFIMVLKDASLVTMIGLADLTQTTFKISNSNATMTVYFPALVLYLIITAFFTFTFNRLEKRFSIHL